MAEEISRSSAEQMVVDPRSVEAALREVVRAWESLPAGDHSAYEVEQWLRHESSSGCATR